MLHYILYFDFFHVPSSVPKKYLALAIFSYKVPLNENVTKCVPPSGFCINVRGAFTWRHQLSCSFESLCSVSEFGRAQVANHIAWTSIVHSPFHLIKLKFNLCSNAFVDFFAIFLLPIQSFSRQISIILLKLSNKYYF